MAKSVQPNLATSYDRVVDLKRLQFIVDNISTVNPKEGRILDVGCGNGNISRHIGNLGFKIHGIDISEKAIKKAKSYTNNTNIEFSVKNAEELAIEGSLYDVIICSEVLEHLEKPEVLVNTLYKILKKDGTLIVTVPNGKGPREVLMTKPMQWIRRNNGSMWNMLTRLKKGLGYSGKTVQSDADNLDHVHFFTKRDLLIISKENNFTITKVEKADFLEDIFPISFFTKRIKLLQKLDCKIADILPHYFTGGFHTIWKKNV